MDGKKNVNNVSVDDFVEAVNERIKADINSYNYPMSESGTFIYGLNMMVERYLENYCMNNVDDLCQFKQNAIRSICNDEYFKSELQNVYPYFELLDLNQNLNLEKLNNILLDEDTVISIFGKWGYRENSNSRDGYSESDLKKIVKIFTNLSKNVSLIKGSNKILWSYNRTNVGIFFKKMYFDSNQLVQVLEFVDPCSGCLGAYGYYSMIKNHLKGKPSQELIEVLVKTDNWQKYAVEIVGIFLNKHLENNENIHASLKEILCGEGCYKDFSRALLKIDNISDQFKIKNIQFDNNGQISHDKANPFLYRLFSNNIKIVINKGAGSVKSFVLEAINTDDIKNLSPEVLRSLLSEESDLNQWVQDVLNESLDEVKDDMAKNFSLKDKLDTLDKIMNAKSMAIESFIKNSKRSMELMNKYGTLLEQKNKNWLNKVFLKPDTVDQILKNSPSLHLWDFNKIKRYRVKSKDIKNFVQIWNVSTYNLHIKNESFIELLKQDYGQDLRALNQYINECLKEELFNKNDINYIIENSKSLLISNFIQENNKNYANLLPNNFVLNEVELEDKTVEEYFKILNKYLLNNKDVIEKINVEALDKSIEFWNKGLENKHGFSKEIVIMFLTKGNNLNDYVQNVFRYALKNELNNWSEVINAKSIAIESFIKKDNKTEKRYEILLLPENKDLLNQIKLERSTVESCLKLFETWSIIGTKFEATKDNLRALNESIKLWNVGLDNADQIKLKLRDIMCRFKGDNWICNNLDVILDESSFIDFNYSLDDNELLSVLQYVKDGGITDKFLKHIEKHYSVSKNSEGVIEHSFFVSQILYELIRTSNGYEQKDKDKVNEAIYNVLQKPIILNQSYDYRWFRNVIRLVLLDKNLTKKQKGDFFNQSADLKEILEEHKLEIMCLSAGHNIIFLVQKRNCSENNINDNNHIPRIQDEDNRCAIW